MGSGMAGFNADSEIIWKFRNFEKFLGDVFHIKKVSTNQIASHKPIPEPRNWRK